MKILSICFLLLFISGCKKRQLQIPNISTEYIDFFALSKKDINDIPDKCIVQTKYIKILPDSADLLFSEINKIQISNHKIYILDKFQRLLGIYDMSGKGIGKVGNVGRAPEEYLNLTDFSINKDGNIHIIDGRLDKMNIYDKNLNFITSQKLPFEADIFQCLDDGGYLFGLSSWNKQLNSNDKIVKTDSMLNSSIRFCEYEKGIDPNYWISFYQFLQTEKYIIYNRFFDNNIYLFSKNGKPLKNIHFDFGEKNVPEIALKNIEKKEKMYDHLCCLKNFTIVNDDYLLGYIWDERIDKIFLIDKTAGILYLGEPHPFNKLGNVIGICEEGIISCIHPGDYLTYKKDLQLPEEIKQHLNNEGVVLRLYSFNNKNKSK